jgi:hypothetical protein
VPSLDQSKNPIVMAPKHTLSLLAAAALMLLGTVSADFAPANSSNVVTPITATVS